MAYLDNDGVTRLTTDLKDRLAPIDHDHAASDITSGELAIARGGTGASTAANARANLEVVKDSAIAYVESTTATANHAVGDYFMLGNVLMKATAAIAAGETINASKATPATVQGQIDTLRDSVTRRGGNVSESYVGSSNYDKVVITVQRNDDGRYQLLANESGIRLYNLTTNVVLWSLP